jgi:thiosulfate/3-mercaptopyruvate sulfurtransferase
MKTFRYASSAVLAVAAVVAAGAAPRGVHTVLASGAVADDPWTAAQTVQPADLAHEISSGHSSSKPTIFYVGFRPLYQGAHIPGAAYHGAAGKPDGLADLKAAAQSLPRDTNLVIYCGCCPMEKCPNIRQAFSALSDMGFTHLRVLILPTDFHTDWIDKGYPVEKGQ